LFALAAIPSFALILDAPQYAWRTTMSQSLLAQFGDSFERVERALGALRKGGGVLVTDDEQRENEGDLIFAAESLTKSQMAMLIRECSGIVCLCLTPEKVRALGLPMMVEVNTSRFQTAYTVSIEAANGVTTGVSASDRVATVKAAIADDAKPEDLRRPGHIFPLRARAGGVLERAGHTEATVDLMKLAGLKPCGVLCELTNVDGTMARLPEIIAFARMQDMPVVSVHDLVQYRIAKETHRSYADFSKTTLLQGEGL
jgi:3,4-dihydroxy 2-butanone 4-phosphate synthase